jgi:hypothetical protein
MPQGLPTLPANLGGMIAGNFEGVDLTVPIVAIARIAAIVVSCIGRALWTTGRKRRACAASRWRRALNGILHRAGQVTTVAAAVILIGGTLIGLRHKSVEQINREEATFRCAEMLYPQFLDWLNTGASPDLWWDSGPPMRHRTPGQP